MNLKTFAENAQKSVVKAALKKQSDRNKIALAIERQISNCLNGYEGIMIECYGQYRSFRKSVFGGIEPFNANELLKIDGLPAILTNALKIESIVDMFSDGNNDGSKNRLSFYFQPNTDIVIFNVSTPQSHSIIKGGVVAMVHKSMTDSFGEAEVSTRDEFEATMPDVENPASLTASDDPRETLPDYEQMLRSGGQGSGAWDLPQVDSDTI